MAGNLWKIQLGTISGASVTASNVRFGEYWGQKKSDNCPSLANPREFCVLNGVTLYIYAPSEPNAFYGGVTPVFSTTPANYPPIYVNGKSWLTFQHIQLMGFDQYGVYVGGGADNLVFANMEADGMVPNGPLPQGFYVNASSPSSIQFINDEGLFGNRTGPKRKNPPSPSLALRFNSPKLWRIARSWTKPNSSKDDPR